MEKVKMNEILHKTHRNSWLWIFLYESVGSGTRLFCEEYSQSIGWGAPELESRPRTAKSAESESRERQEASVGVFSMLLNVSNRIRAEISSRIAQISLERKIPLRSLKSVIQRRFVLIWDSCPHIFDVLGCEIAPDHRKKHFP